MVCRDTFCIIESQIIETCVLCNTAPTLVVQTSPSSVRVLDVAPYNQFTVTCTARAEFNGEGIPYSMTIDWIRRKQTDGAVTFEDVDPTQYETTVIRDNGYQSILTTTETDTQNMITYRCRAQLTDEGGNDLGIMTTDTTDVEVQGMCPSVFWILYIRIDVKCTLW